MLRFILLILISNYAFADVVTPTDRVVNCVNIRPDPSADNAPLLCLAKGEYIEYIETVTRYYKVKLEDGRDGFASSSWSEVIPDPVDIAAAPFAVHFIDVGTGDSAIIDMGDKEIIIDGGNYANTLRNYVNENDLIQGEIELVIVTHGDTDHWKGLVRLLGFDDVENNPPSVAEFWDAGYDRDCNSPTAGGKVNYLAFIEDMKSIVPAANFHRPLENTHQAADKTPGNIPISFVLPSLPGVEITVLHSESSPTASECSYAINNASIVIKIEIDGTSFLFTGDANGKGRSEAGSVVPTHVEAKLLALEDAHPGVLEADVLKVPHHGSETASTEKFIEAVSPEFAIFSASTLHHLPKSDVVSRYEEVDSIILRTDVNRGSGIDHIVCTKLEGELVCNFSDTLGDASQ